MMLVAIDAYQQPYVPFQLTTKEFFQEVRDHLTPTGVAVINAGRTNSDFRLVDALAADDALGFSQCLYHRYSAFYQQPGNWHQLADLAQQFHDQYR